MTDKADDVEVLFADEEITLAGESIVVREFRYSDGLKAAALARPLFVDLREMMQNQAADIEAEALDCLIGTHHGIWMQLIAMSTGQTVEWVQALPDRHGVALSMAFWRVNGPFVTRRLVLAGAVAAGLERLFRSRRSSRSSSAPDTDATTTTSETG